MATMSAEVVSIFETGDYEQQIARAAERLRAGGVVVLPTETVYGAAAVLGNDSSIQRLKAIRVSAGGTAGKPFTIHLARREQAMRYIGEVGETATRLMRKLWPGPVSLVFDVPAEKRAAVSKELAVPESELYINGTITL